VDTDHSGEIEWPEYLTIMRKFYPQKLQEFEKKWYGPAQKFTEFSREDIGVFAESFRTYDLDGSGAISTDELRFAFAAMGQGISEEQLQKVIHTYDADNSGEIDWPEFLEIMSDMYKGVSLNERANKKQEQAKPAMAPAMAPAAAPAKPMTAPVTTPTKTTPAPAAAAPTKPAAFTPAVAKPVTAPASPKVQVGGQRTANPTCSACGKTVYPIEAISAADRTWHKGCFKCEAEEGCNLSLTLKTFTAVAGKVYCSKHVPKNKPTQVSATGNMVLQSAMSAPKLQKAAGIQKNMRTTFGSDDMANK